MSELLYYIKKDEHSSDALEKILSDNKNIKFVSLMGVDLGGNATDEKIPVSLFLDDIDSFLNSSIQTDGSSVELHDIATLNNAKVDLMADKDATWFVDYNHNFYDEETDKPVGTLKIPAFLIHDNKKVCSRATLKRAEEHFKQSILDIINKYPQVLDNTDINSPEEIESIGLTSATELEFWVNTPEDKADLEKLFVSQSLKEQYWKRTHGIIRTCLEMCLIELERYGLEPEMAHKEVGGIHSSINNEGSTNHAMEQLEISWKFNTPLQAADNELLVREVVYDIFESHGLEVSFKAKPIHGVAGSGAHTHVGVSAKLKNGKFVNLFAPKNLREDYLSPIGYGALMGILKNYEVLAPIVTNTNDGFNRLVPGFEAPVCTVTSLGHSYEIPSRNRSVLVGLIRDIENPKTLRFELRSPNPQSNKYLVISGCYQTMLDGILAVVENGKFDTKELEKEISKSEEETGFYLEEGRKYRDENNVFEFYTLEERNKMFGIPPATVYEAMLNFENYPEKLKVLTCGDVFTESILTSFKAGSLDKWKKKLSSRIIDRNIRLLRTFVKLHTGENMDALDEVMWDSIVQIKFDLMKNTLKGPSIYGMIKNAIDLGNFKEASDLQIIAKSKMEEIQQLYVNYRKNIY
ncbi:glutamine synthetase [Peptostreptococcus anaerobius]|uniref:glutamine synthetase n=2 Tax=Peptostreptococcus porci TaxID=2652282 RepID=A0A6N7X1A7_9FIRM|nr:glutamine synthetase [Peptostreptococcus porci]MDD7182813.1 glutamine synthetase [Peptostreptococcus porci]MDY5965140.1 glutamine synthetase [Peptostreptococcus porci]MST61901.1 glutamine synthetase [Peptostreptococcus porci]